MVNELSCQVPTLEERVDFNKSCIAQAIQTRSVVTTTDTSVRLRRRHSTAWAILHDFYATRAHTDCFSENTILVVFAVLGQSSNELDRWGQGADVARCGRCGFPLKKKRPLGGYHGIRDPKRLGAKHSNPPILTTEADLRRTILSMTHIDMIYIWGFVPLETKRSDWTHGGRLDRWLEDGTMPDTAWNAYLPFCPVHNNGATFGVDVSSLFQDPSDLPHLFGWRLYSYLMQHTQVEVIDAVMWELDIQVAWPSLSARNRTATLRRSRQLLLQ